MLKYIFIMLTRWDNSQRVDTWLGHITLTHSQIFFFSNSLIPLVFAVKQHIPILYDHPGIEQKIYSIQGVNPYHYSMEAVSYQYTEIN